MLVHDRRSDRCEQPVAGRPNAGAARQLLSTVSDNRAPFSGLAEPPDGPIDRIRMRTERSETRCVACIICSEMNIVDRLAAAAGSLTPSEQRAALLLEKDPPAVAFGSLAEVAAAAGTSGPTVVRLATQARLLGLRRDERLDPRGAVASSRPRC